MSSLTVSFIQTQLSWENKTANLENFQEKTDALPAGAELVLLPEMFTTGFSMNPEKLAEPLDGPTVQWMKEQAAKKNIALAGSYIAAEDGKYYNRLIYALPNGHTGIYDKRHLFSFAGEDEHYAAGSKRLITSLKGWKINMQVCYDLRFPCWARQQHGENANEPEYDILVYVANWPAKRSYAWKSLLVARAIENQCYVIGVNRVGEDGKGISYSGDSMLIDPLGEIMYNCEDREETYTATLRKEDLEAVRSKFAFLKDRDKINIE